MSINVYKNVYSSVSERRPDNVESEFVTIACKKAFLLSVSDIIQSHQLSRQLDSFFIYRVRMRAL